MFSLLLAILVSAQIDSTELWVGDQTTIHIQAIQEKNEKVSFPVYGETLVPGIEIVSQSLLDTTPQTDGRICVNKDLVITSFEDSLFYINPLPIVTETGDTLYTGGMSLNVIQPFEIDTVDNAITDIKDVYRAKIWWWGIIRWILLGIGIIGIGIGLFFLVRYLRKLKAAQQNQEALNPELLRPAEEVALEKLDAIKAAKIWQIGQHKQYHIDLTDVIREYIARHFEVSSQEKTSDETLSSLKPLMSDQRELYSKLDKMLRLADMVKFAKWQPTPDENEVSLLIAYQFVKETTPVATEENEKDSEITKVE